MQVNNEADKQSPKSDSFWRLFARKTPDTWIGRLLAIAVNLILVIAFVGWLTHLARSASWGRILFVTIFVVAIFLLAILSRVFPIVEQTIKAAFRVYGRFVYWYFVTAAPILFFFWLAPRILVKSEILQWVVFVGWGLLLIFGSTAVFTEKYRNRFFPWLQRKVGNFAPCAYALNLLFVAWLFFSSVTYVLVRNEILRLDRPAVAVSADGTRQAPAEVTADHIRDFYFWHFLDAVPLVKVNETLRYKEPLTYSGAGVGWLLLTFQLIVILPVIRAFAWYWKHDEPVVRPAVEVYRASLRTRSADKN